MNVRSAGDDAQSRSERWLRILLPIVVLAAGVALWHLVVRLYDLPPYVLPGPLLVFSTLVSDWPVLSASLMVSKIARRIQVAMRSFRAAIWSAR